MTNTNKNHVIASTPPVQPENIPEQLKREQRWIGWWPGPLKSNGKFDKVPVHPQTGANINPLDPENWLTFEEAMDALRRGMAKGVGFVLSDEHPVHLNDDDFFYVALDFDNCASADAELEALWSARRNVL